MAASDRCGPSMRLVILAQGRRASPTVGRFSAKVASVMFDHWELSVTIDACRGKPCPYGSLRLDQCMVPIHLEHSLLLAVYPYLTPCASGVPSEIGAAVVHLYELWVLERAHSQLRPCGFCFSHRRDRCGGDMFMSCEWCACFSHNS